MKNSRLILMFFVVALIFFQCQDSELVAPQRDIQVEALIAGTTYQTGTVYYVSTSGNDNNNGSSSSPWRTVRAAVSKVPANKGVTIRISAGTYVESGQIVVPTGVNIEGEGRDQVILKASSSLYYYPTTPGYAADRFLINVGSNYMMAGNQVLKNFTIDGDGKKLHGGIYVRYRSNVNVENVRVQYTNFTAVWLWDAKDAGLNTISTLNCSWASAGWQSGAINLGNLERVDITGLDINEGVGYGIKCIGPSGINSMKQVTIHDSRISVNPIGTWNGGSAPNFAVEMYQSAFVGCEIYNCYIDNTMSLVTPSVSSTGVTGLRVHDNTFDMDSRSKGEGYGIELSMNDIEIDHNYFLKGVQGIANWASTAKNWNIHHNYFYGIQGIYPGEVVRSQSAGLHNLKFYNNTVEFSGNKTANVIGIYGGSSENIDVKNNLIINSNTSYNYYPNQFIHTEGGATINNLTVGSNCLQNMQVGNLVSSLLRTVVHILVDPQITRSGIRPTPYYVLSSSSPLIDGGVNVGLPYSGSRPDIGAFESGYTTQSNPTTPAQPTAPTSPSNPTGPFYSVTLNASGATVKGNVVKGSDAMGTYFGVNKGAGQNWTVPTASMAYFNYAAPADGNYNIWIKVKSTTVGGFWIYDMKGHYTSWNSGVHSDWTWVKVVDATNGQVTTYPLVKGANTIQFQWQYDNTQINKVVLTTDPNFVPSN